MLKIDDHVRSTLGRARYLFRRFGGGALWDISAKTRVDKESCMRRKAGKEIGTRGHCVLVWKALVCRLPTSTWFWRQFQIQAQRVPKDVGNGGSRTNHGSDARLPAHHVLTHDDLTFFVGCVYMTSLWSWEMLNLFNDQCRALKFPFHWIRSTTMDNIKFWDTRLSSLRLRPENLTLPSTWSPFK